VSASRLDLPDIHTPGGDLEFLLGVLFNQQVRAETAWRAPARLAERLGGLDVAALSVAAPDALGAIMRRRPAVHPFAGPMSRYVIGICGRLVEDFGARAANLWAGPPTAATLLGRLTGMPGIGRHKATVAIALLTCEYGVVLTTPGDDLAAEAFSSCPRLHEAIMT
jgi:uncharacterized HhH-GPD family protein